MPDAQDIVVIIAGLLIVAGAALISIPAGVITAGVILFVLAALMEGNQ